MSAQNLYAAQRSSNHERCADELTRPYATGYIIRLQILHGSKRRFIDAGQNRNERDPAIEDFAHGRLAPIVDMPF